MTARNVSFAFLCEGSSDTGLIAHLETLLVDFGAQEATGMPDTRKGTIPARLQQLLTEATEAGIDMVFIHRDSDGPDRDGREREIHRGVEESGCPLPFIPVIPVQETEAWLLLDEQAIRDVVACPKGKQPLKLPKPNAIEGTRNPKEILQKALLAAVEEREEQFQPSPQDIDATPRSLRRRAEPTLLAMPGARHQTGAGTARKSELKGTIRAQPLSHLVRPETGKRPGRCRLQSGWGTDRMVAGLAGVCLVQPAHEFPRPVHRRPPGAPPPTRAHAVPVHL